jgi:sugar O-acyltransferase (sialic acid O-acetyltransferase NeuD family)
MNHDVIIYGAGGMAQEIYEWSFNNGPISSIGNVRGYFSDFGPDSHFEIVTGLAFVDLKDAIATFSDLHILLCVGEPEARRETAQRIAQQGGKLHTYIHPTAIVAKSAQIGPGCVIYPFAVVSCNTKLGQCVAINSYTGIGHDVEVGDYCVISAQVDLTGHVKLGQAVFIGSGARIVPKKKIGAHSKIGAGVTVIKSLAAKSIIYPKANKVEQ